ncbi:PepSY domain-containing protein, partial [Escherichia coli]
MSAVAAAVTRLHPGTVLQIELEETRSPRPYYEIQLLTREGREQLLRADAQTGRILAEPVLSREQAATLQPLP